MKAISFHTCAGKACIDVKRGRGKMDTIVMDADELRKKLADDLPDYERWMYNCAAETLSMATGKPVDLPPEQMRMFV